MTSKDATDKASRDALFKSVIRGDVEETKGILQSNSEVDINKTFNRQGRKLLHLACEHGHINMVRCLISLGANTNTIGYYCYPTIKYTPLSLAVSNNHHDIVSALVSEFGCDPSDGVSLHTACEHGNLSMVKTLIECGASVDDKDGDDNTSLHLTAKIERNETMQALLSTFKSDPNIKNKEGRTPLHIACMCGNLSGVELLIKHGARVNANDIHSYTPLSLAVLNNHTSIVSALVSEFGCDPNDGVSLHTACKHGNMKMVKCGAHVNDKDNFGKTLLLTAGNLSIFDDVIDEDTDINTFLYQNKSNINTKKETQLHIACANGNLSGVRLLIKNGASVKNARDVHHPTPLVLAVLNNHTSIVSALVSEFGCDPNDGVSLHTACKHDNLSMVKTLIECGASVDDKDGDDNTSLHLTAKINRNETMHALLSDFKCDPNIKNKEGRTPLHIACMCGNLSGVELLRKHGARANANDIHSYTPLSLAVLNNHTSIVSALVSEFGCDPNDGVSLHTACRCGDLSMVRTLIGCGASVNEKDVGGKTPLSLAVLNNHTSIVSALVSEFGCDPNDGVSLHTACKHGSMKMVMCGAHVNDKHGNLSMVKTLIECGASVDGKDGDGNTSLHLTAKIKRNETMQALLSDFKSDPNIKNKEGKTPLHIACMCGNLSGVELLRKHGARVNANDIHSYTPLSLAVLNNHTSIVSKLVNECGCDPNDGISLHTACRCGNLSMARTLIKCGSKVNGKDARGNTPLSLAVLHSHFSLVSALLSEFGCDPNDGVSLHTACKHGNMKMVKTLILEHGANVNDKDVDGNTPLHLTTKNVKKETMQSLLKNFKSNPNIKNNEGRTPLHIACMYGNLSGVKLLVEHGASVSAKKVDDEGNTPLHLCSERGHSECVQFLLHKVQSPVYARNRAGKTPRELLSNAIGEVRNIFEEYILEHQDTIKKEYQLQKLAATRYSGSHCITRVFVVGHPGAGKSSLVEALKREGFIQSFNRVSSKSVALYTAGIVPSIHTSDSYGRVQFYDFAGDPEYYSSHAAILEKLFLSDIGNNICIIVLNLEEKGDKLKGNYLYWLTFINHNTKNLRHPPSVIVTGSHADLLSKQGLQKKEDCIKSLLNETDHVYLSLDCCGPGSTNIKILRQQIQERSKIFEPYVLSHEGSVLLGLLEKDFSNVIACTAKTIASHITEVNIWLPTSLSGLYPILEELQAIGSLLILGGKEEDCYLVLNVSQLTNEVHKRLFSVEAFSNKPDMASFNIGLLPQSLIQEVLPPYITKECLTQLQYCQEISHVEIGRDYFVSPSSEGVGVSSSPDKSLLFFPALCKLDRNIISWFIPPDGSYSIGWLARRTNDRDYFPPRFLHVLLLRVSLRFTLLAPTNLADTPADNVLLMRRCKMWKTGVHWLMAKKGVECEVDVYSRKEVVVSVRSKKCHSKEALTVFNSIISCVMEAKAEFCHSIQLKCFLLDKIGCLSKDNLFLIGEVEEALRDGDNSVLSFEGGALMYSSQLLLVECTFWGSLFSLDEKTVLKYLHKIVGKWFKLGVYLDLPETDLNIIEYNHPIRMLKGARKRW